MDSALKAAPDTFFSAAAKYPEVLTDFIRSRFYHGLYQYRPGNNYLAWIGTRLLKRSVNEIWRADDILKSTYCYCGQQCLVMMEMLMKKGYKVRKVTLHSDKFKAGHFVFETYFDNAWHMYDPDEEPDLHSLRALKRPDVATIAADTAMLSQIYTDNSLMMRDLFQHPNTGKENELMPEKIYLFQWVTKYVSIFSWIPLLGILLFYLRKSRRKKMALQTGKNHPNSTGK